MTLQEELQKLARLTKESSKEIVAEQIRKIGEKNGESVYQIIVMLTKERMERGYTKKYSLRELKEKLPWEKSTVIERLQRTVEEGVLKHEKRRYQLNTENELAKRVWNYYNEPNYREKEKVEEIRKLILWKRKLERELEEEERKRGRKRRYRKATKKEEKEWIKKVITGVEGEDGLRNIAEKERKEILGYRKN